MTEQTPEAPVTGEPMPIPPASVEEQLRKRVGRLRGWVIGLSVALALVVVLIGGCGALFAFEYFGPGFMGMDGLDPDEQAASLEKSVKDAYRDDLESVKVEKVDVGESIPFPYSIMMGEEFSQFAVTYRLKGVDAEFSNVVMDESEFAYTGFIPVENPFSSRLEMDDLRSLLNVYAAESDSPVGGVTRYGEWLANYSESESVPDTITIEGVDYPANDLWSVAQGNTAEGAQAVYDGMSPAMTYVFRRDPKTRKFVYLGRERSAW